MNANIKTFAIQFVAVALLMSLALFVPAGTLAWMPGWLFLVTFLSFFLAVSLWLFKHNPGLQEERLRIGKADQQSVDKVLYPVLFIGFMLWLGIAALDAGRLHWSPVPAWLNVVGGIVLLGSFYLLFLTFRANSYLSTLVRLQSDRGHRVVSSGPYAFVRHPMYAANTAFAVGTALMLGSWYAVLLGLLLGALMGWRALLEERLLRENLSGYTDYMTRVKYRLIPLIW